MTDAFLLGMPSRKSVNFRLSAFTSLPPPPNQHAWEHMPSRDRDENCRRFDHTTYCNEALESLIPLLSIMAGMEKALMNYCH